VLAERLSRKVEGGERERDSVTDWTEKVSQMIRKPELQEMDENQLFVVERDLSTGLGAQIHCLGLLLFPVYVCKR